ncbi:hypothetical protein DAPPUDRAFT_256615 [Daphnia pulex]|uniref:Uncharacterized protein n=1 Tax=Daphnia pulex TaxID=6669 RepID=E9HBS2_DAPPU|nr:hypothetical protein DAPPUDRAFT_256615 [Daphnia pulex]|eukprot:EFX70767.1 hypothetical protein DAPPUDRAFT_256615 [Daphnia pulex]
MNAKGYTRFQSYLPKAADVKSKYLLKEYSKTPKSSVSLQFSCLGVFGEQLRRNEHKCAPSVVGLDSALKENATIKCIPGAPLKVVRPPQKLMESAAAHSASPAGCAAASSRYSLQQALEIADECDRRSQGADHERPRIPGPRRSQRLPAAAIAIPYYYAV